MQELVKNKEDTSLTLRAVLSELQEYKRQLCAMSVDLVADDLVTGVDALTGEPAVVFRGKSLKKLETIIKYVEVLSAVNKAELSVAEVTKNLLNNEQK